MTEERINYEVIEVGWASISEAKRITGISRPTIIKRVNEGKCRDRWFKQYHQVRIEDLRAGEIVEVVGS